MSDKPRRRVVTPPANKSTGERLIRKYGNRRLYDTGASRYVTLDDLVEVFSSEETVRVVDAVSGEDLTKKVLAQAILSEEDRTGAQIIPTEMLRDLLRQRSKAGGDVGRRRLAKAAAAGGAAAGGAEINELRNRLKALEKQLTSKR